MAKEHNYKLQIAWAGNTGEGTKDYRSYERSFEVISGGKPALLGSSDPAYRGDPNKWNPEELFLASLSSCHMLWYLHLCSDQKIIVAKYFDNIEAVMAIEPSGSGSFKEVILRPKIVITEQSRIVDAEALHEKAHRFCYIANSINFPVKVAAEISA